MVLSGGGVTIDSAQLDNDNTFLMSGALTLTVVAEAADTVDLSNITFDPNAIGNFTITGSAGADTIIGSAVVDNLDPGAGNDTITLGTGIDHINYTTGADGTDTVTDFTTGTDQYETNFQTSNKNNNGADQNYVVQTAVVDTSSALALNTDAADVEQITGVTLSVADAADEAKVIAAISNGTVTIHTASDKAMLSVVTSTHTFLYEVTEAGGNTAITAAEDTIALVGIFTNAVQFATGDIDKKSNGRAAALVAAKTPEINLRGFFFKTAIIRPLSAQGLRSGEAHSGTLRHILAVTELGWLIVFTQ